MNTADLKSYAYEIINWLKSDRYILENGMFTKTVKENQKSHVHILQDLGDYLPFFGVFGDIDFIQNHIRNVMKIAPHGILPSQIKKYGQSVVTSYEHSDFLLGLIDVKKYISSDNIENYLNTAFKNITKRFHFDSSPQSYFFSNFHTSFPIADTRDGMYIELCMDEILQKRESRLLADNLFLFFSKNAFFESFSVFPEFIIHNEIFKKIVTLNRKIKKRCEKIVVTKNNTNMLCGFLEYFKCTGSREARFSVIKLIDGLIDHCMYKNAMILQKENIHQICSLKDVHLTANFSVIDAMCDAQKFIGYERINNIVSEIADYWLTLQSDVTGLFPISPDSECDDLDNQTDMSIALVKLSEISGEEKYKEAAEKCVLGVLQHHRAQGGYYNSVNIHTGQVVDATFKTKFIALFLKALYVFSENVSVYENKQIFNLVKDR